MFQEQKEDHATPRLVGGQCWVGSIWLLDEEDAERGTSSASTTRARLDPMLHSERLAARSSLFLVANACAA